MSDLTPHSIDAERAVLGAILLDNDALELADLRPEQFFRQAHQRLYRAMVELRRKGLAIDEVTLIEAMTASGELDTVGGSTYIAGITDGLTRSTNVPSYAKTVRRLATQRAIIHVSRALEKQAHDRDADENELIDFAESQLTAIAVQQQTDLVGGGQLASEAVKWLEDNAARAQLGRMSGVTSGLRDLDNLTDGFQPGTLNVIGARPSQGKTALALQFALSAGGPVAFFSLEMKRASLSARALAWLAKVDGWALKRGRLSDREYARLSSALDDLANSGLAIDDASEANVWQLRSKCRRYKAQHGLAMVVVDYLQLLTPPKDKRGQRNREQDVAAMSRSLKALAKDLHVPVLMLAQLNRAAEGRGDAPPKLSDLRESGAIEQDADVVIFLHRPGGKSVKDEGEALLILAKHREGPTGTVQTLWRPTMTRFDPYPSYRERTA